ncbi:MAG: hypothetical protein V7785_21805 [Bermanella sp.]
MSLLIVDPINSGCWHSYFNRTFIEAFSNCENVSNVHVLLEKSQYNESVIKCFVDSSKVWTAEYIKSNIRGGVGGSLTIVRALYSSFRLINASEINTLVILASDNLLVPAFMFFMKKLNKNINIIVVLHNNLGGVEASLLKKSIWRMALKNSHGILLAQYLGDRARKYLGKNVHVVDHPTYENVISSNTLNVKTTPYKYDFLILGRHSESFGDNDFTVGFLSTCSRLMKKDVNIAIGSNSGNLGSYNGINISQYSFPIGADEYTTLLEQAKYIILPPEAGLRLTASGVHLDAITASVPVIAPSLGVFYENVPVSCRKLLYEGCNLKDALRFALELEDSGYRDLKADIKLSAKKFNLTETSLKLNLLLTSIKG